MRTKNCLKAVFTAIIMLFVVLVSETSLFAMSNIVEFTAIGKVESIYKERVSMNVLYIVASDPASIGVATGSWISFDLPRAYSEKSNRRQSQISYGNVIEAVLIGNVATEYETNNEDGDKTISSTVTPVLLWTAQSVKKVKNAKDYLPTKEDDKKGRKKNKKKEEEPLKIWTQEETVRGKVLVKNDKVYLKEDRLGKKDKGLEVLSEEWSAKLKDLHDSRVVLHGVTHRTGVASGTLEISNVLKVYPK